MTDYRIEAATKEEWAERALRAERKLVETAIDCNTRYAELEDRLDAARQDAREAEAHAEELAAKLAKAVEALDAWLNVAAHCSIEEGVCCCGDDMENHSPPMVSGHTPLDHGTYIAERLEETTRATLAELKGQDDD